MYPDEAVFAEREGDVRHGAGPGPCRAQYFVCIFACGRAASGTNAAGQAREGPGGARRCPGNASGTPRERPGDAPGTPRGHSRKALQRGGAKIRGQLEDNLEDNLVDNYIFLGIRDVRA